MRRGGIAIAWSGFRYLRFEPRPIHLHQRPWYDVSRWKFSLTISTGGVWLIFFGPVVWARDLNRIDPAHRKAWW